MEKEWQKTLETINEFKEKDPDRYSILKDVVSLDIGQVLSKLNEFFMIEEENIKKENEKSYVTDTYEYEVMTFATELVKSMVPIHEELKNYEDYGSLLGQRHIAYGFYSIIHFKYNEDINKYEDILNEEIFNKSLYRGLVEFYKKFYGRFNDNEQAIKLLCEFYEDIGDLDNTVDSIFHHITSAGTANDFGFAYNGIEIIRKYIGKLPIEIIDKLLQKYDLYRIINQKVYRHQIFQIIESSIISPKEKPKYKFSYLDSIFIADHMNNILYEKYGENDLNLIPQYNDLQIDLSVPKIGLIKSSVTEDTYAYWTNGCSVQRSFVVDGKVVIKINLGDDNKKISLINIGDSRNKLEFDFNYNDWTLNIYGSRETEQKFQDFVFGLSSGENEIVYNNMTFSLLYLNNYRGMDKTLVDFDHRFTYDCENKEVINKIDASLIPSFYGKKVYSLSCIVGKNGSGKTSTVEFLRGTFFKLLSLIGEYGMVCENGYVSEADYGAYDILDKGSEFLVIFNLGSEAYYLTNMEGVSVEVVRPFSSNNYRNNNEFSKIIYFSNMISINQDNLYIDEKMISRNQTLDEGLGKSLNDIRQSDFSESESFIRKRRIINSQRERHDISKVDNKEVNKDLCYQLAFLNHLTPENLEIYLDMPGDKEFILKSVSADKEEMKLPLPYSLKDNIDSLEPFLTLPDAKLEYFSSGEYAKFSFLSKLYWFLEGYQKYVKVFRDKLGAFGENEFDPNEGLLEDETALIFIDEGETYYHPEWQRCYVKTLLDYINFTEMGNKLQIVITTNSPFIISDILGEDITYLSKDKKKSDLTFGQNIHKLLKDNFFMSFTIGEYSRELIENIMKWLWYDEDDSNNADKINIGEELSQYFGKGIEEKDYYEKIGCLINKIGEQIYREKLQDMLNDSRFNKESEINRLKRQKDDIENRLKELEGRVEI